jgi:receptor-type tyrosine-protein phosphatase gamma
LVLQVNYWITDVEDETMAQFKIIKGQANRGLILGLHQATSYTVNIQAFNSAGLTAVSEDYTTKTLRHAPKEAPQEVYLSITSDEEIQLEWRGVSTTIDEEPLEGYKVRLHNTVLLWISLSASPTNAWQHSEGLHVHSHCILISKGICNWL